MADLSLDLLTRARDDVGVFAEVLVGEPLWPHQLDLLCSPARTRCILAGRQCGKSRALAVLALHETFRAPGRLVLIVSATELGAKRLLAEVAALASAPILAGSVVDEQKLELALSNGSRIVSVPASERAVRGWTADLLIVDEAAFVPDDVLAAARFVTVARGGRRVMASTPYGRRDRPFAVAYEAGRNRSDGYRSFQWPSTVSPLVSDAVLDEWRPTMTDREWRSEILGEWADDAGAFFTSDELDGSVADYALIPPGEADGHGDVVGGIDWGMAADANAVVLLGVLADGGVNVDAVGRDAVFFLPWLEAHHRMPYSRFVDRLVDVCDWRARFGHRVLYLASETNGVGAAPTEMLKDRAWDRGVGVGVIPVHTDARRKESAFGAIKLLLQQGRLVLPRHPELLRQLAALEFEQLDSGATRIAVPERAGHDDIAMALAQAVSCVRVSTTFRWSPAEVNRDGGKELVTGRGVRIHRRPRVCRETGWTAFRGPAGREKGDGW